ncbi:hypothetical protein D3C87_02470 [compost metagenome]
MTKSKYIVIAHYDLDRKITKEECWDALQQDEKDEAIFIDFGVGNSQLSELYDLSFNNIALLQQRKFIELVKPLLDENPNAKIAYFGYVSIPISFHFGYLLGNSRPYIIYQRRGNKSWFKETDKPTKEYEFSIKPLSLPNEEQKGKGKVIIRVATSTNIEKQSTYEVVPNPENEFDICLEQTHIDSLYSQENIEVVVNAFQEVLNAYSSKLSDREKIHLFISASCGLPFALGTRINPNMYPYIQTYQYSSNESPKYREAVLVTKEVDDRIILTEDNRLVSKIIRDSWEKQLQKGLKPFIKTISGKESENWLQMLCSDEEYESVSQYLCRPWNSVTDIDKTSIKHDSIDTERTDVDDSFEYSDIMNTWAFDDGFLYSLKNRLDQKPETDVMQAARLFFFHEALHYSNEGHRLTREIADGIGQFPKVVEEADYQADVWGLLTEYKYCSIYEPDQLKKGLKVFFCNAIETAVETMWSFSDTGKELHLIQIRSMNRFLNWYWQWVRIEKIDGTSTLKEIIQILFDKPVIEFAGAQMELRGYKTYFKLNSRQYKNYQLAAFSSNKVYRFSPNLIDEIVDGFRFLDGEKIKAGLKSFWTTLG